MLSDTDMNILRCIGRCIVYYIAVCLIISIFVESSWQSALITIAGAAVSVSFFAMLLDLFVGDIGGGIFQKIENWCLRGMFIVVALAAAVSVGLDKIMALFR